MRPTYEELETKLQQAEARCQQVEAELQRARIELDRAIQKIAELEERLNRNSKNSSKPPSSDQKANTGGRQSRERKGQRPGKARLLFPPTKIDKHVPCTRESCPHCGSKDIRLSRQEAEVVQQAEIPEVRATVTEYQLQKYICRACGKRSTAELPLGIPDSAFGPRFMGLVATLTGVFHLAKRETVELIKGLFDIDMGLGSIPNIEARVAVALDPVYQRIHDFVIGGEFCKYFDETTWRDDGKYHVVWVASCDRAAFYRIDPSRSMAAFRRLVGEGRNPKDLPAVTDRYSSYNLLGNRHQYCFAHLIRNFEKYAERKGQDGEIGRALRDHLRKVCHIHSDYREGKITETQRNSLLAPHRIEILYCLVKGDVYGSNALCELCCRLLERFDKLWAFTKEPGMEPTNNSAERDLRKLVLWRKKSYGTRSARGRQFVERITTIAQTIKKQTRAILSTIQQTMVNFCARAGPPPIFDHLLA